ncbi:hypothetical protein QJQ45_014055, partial [Haematococcus lacustris]
DVAAARTVVVDSCVPGHYSWDTELRVFAELPGICGQLRLQEEPAIVPVDGELMQGQSKAPQVPSLDAALGPKKGLDYSALFAERAVEEPAPSASSQPITQAAATPAPTAALATCTSGAEPVPPEQQAIQPGPHHGSAVKLQGGPWQDDEGKAAGWWTKMDAGDLNKVEELVKGAAAAFTPQFVGCSGLTSKLDYSAAHCVSTEPQQQQ